MKIYGAFLHIPYPTPGHKEPHTEYVFGRTREEADRLAYEKWVLPDTKPGEWIYEDDNAETPQAWANDLIDRAEKGEYQGVVKEVWNGDNGDWVEFFEGELPKENLPCRHGFDPDECGCEGVEVE